MAHHKYPTIQFKLKTEIVITKLPEKFYIERIFHSGGELMTDKIHCLVVGMPKTGQITNNRTKVRTEHQTYQNRKNPSKQNHQPNQPIEDIQTVKIIFRTQ